MKAVTVTLKFGKPEVWLVPGGDLLLMDSINDETTVRMNVSKERRKQYGLKAPKGTDTVIFSTTLSVKKARDYFKSMDFERLGYL